MNKNTDIQHFHCLMSLWLDGTATISQEEELIDLACRLSREQSDLLSDTERRDINMLVELGGIDLSESAATLSYEPPAPQRSHFSRLYIASVAAMLAILICAGVWMFKTDDNRPVTQLAVNKPHTEAPIPVSSRQSTQNEAPPTENIAQEVVPPAVKAPVKTSPAVAEPCEEDTLQVREITDPQEAAELMNESWQLVADNIRLARHTSIQAASSFTDNINILNEII